jgi:predicted acyl esterase
MGDRTLTPTHPAPAVTGRNDIVVANVQDGPQPMLMERDVPIIARDGEVLYVNAFRPHGERRFPVVISAAIDDQDTINLD